VTAQAAWPKGYALREFKSIDSTNEEARRMALAGETGPVWISAAKQTAGRGRRGRNWETPVGNLAATLLLRPDRAPAQAAQLSFVAALAASEMIQSFARTSRVEVKWPNDVLADGRKIAGILLESTSADGRLDWLAIGVGVNLAWHPVDTEFPATSLTALGEKAPPAREALQLLADRWAKWYERWSVEGFREIRDAWLSRAANIGTRIRARLQSGETSGMFEGIDETGALILREAQDRVRIIAAGEVFF
jgi:BirA family biotin operon repressor/biotin-[acetyl-CoA-carboxylase] ligase